MNRRRSRLAVTVLLLVSAILVSVSSISSIPFVQAAASITLNPTYAGRGTVVTVTGSGFSLSNGTALVAPIICNLYSLDLQNSPNTLISSPICSVSGTSISGSFVVNGALTTIYNPYTVIVNVTDAASHYVKAQKTFTVTAINIDPSHAPKGWTVNVNGSLSSTATTCSMSGSPVKTPSCVISGSTGGNFTGSFVVGNVAPGPYTITVTGGGVSVQTTFTVNATTPTIHLYPPLGNPGTIVIAAQNYTGVVPFPTTDTTCSISGSVVASGSCTIMVNATGSYVTAPFTVANVAVGAYTVTVTGSPSGLKASAIFTVTTPFVPTIVATPSDGPAGTVISVSGTGFSTLDTSCQLISTGTGADPFLITSPSCSISGGKLTGKFTVGAATPGLRALNATGNTGDKASVNFLVDSSPVLFFYKPPSLTPVTSGGPGEAISVNVTLGTQFSSGDTSCTISSTPTGLFKSSICVIHLGRLNGTYFVIAGAANGAYAVTVKGNLGDSATAVFTVLVLPSLVLTPSSGATGSLVTFRATGFSITDTGCVVQSGPTSLLITSPTCTISSPQVATGSFTVGPYATTNTKWNVTVKGTPANDVPTGAWALFNVTATISVTPTSGTNGTVVSFTGSGFSWNATSCIVSIVPNIIKSGSGLCGIAGSTGQVSGSFVVNTTTPGVYFVKVNDTFNHFAGASFTVGSPTASIILLPNTVPPGSRSTVAIVGSGFNPSDTSCNVTSSAGLIHPGTIQCSVSGGVVAGAFNITDITDTPGVVPGYYIVTVQASPYGDFASNILYVTPSGILTLTTTFTTTPSTSTASFTTTSTSTSISLTTTSLTTTGVSTQTFSTLTTTTVTGLFTSAFFTLTTATSTLTSLFTTSTTTTTTVTITIGGIISVLLLFGMVVRRLNS